MPAQIGFFDSLKSVAGKVFKYLASITLTGTDGKTITCTQDTALDDTVALSKKANLETANTFTNIAPMTTLAESWIGPSALNGIYFKGGNRGFGTVTPGAKFEVAGASGIIGLSVYTTGTASGDTTQINLGANPDIPTGSVILKSIRTSTAGANTDFSISTVRLGALNENMRVTSTGNTGIGTATIPSMLTVAGLINMKNYTVASLPAGTRGDIAYVTDALAPTFLATIVGGGAVVSPVFFNGTAWVGF